MTTPPSSTRVIAAGVIGNMLEWYDFAIYGYFAGQIGRTSFPSKDPVTQVLAAFSIFFFLSLAFVKRFSEVEGLRLRSEGTGVIAVKGRGYRLSDLEQRFVCNGNSPAMTASE